MLLGVFILCFKRLSYLNKNNMNCLVNLIYITTYYYYYYFFGLILYFFTVKTPFMKKYEIIKTGFFFLTKIKFNNIINYWPPWVKWGQYYNTLFAFFIIIDLYIIKTIFIDVYQLKESSINNTLLTCINIKTILYCLVLIY